MKIIQINIWQGKLLRQVIKLLREEDADVVCMQEVFSWNKESGLLDFANSLEKIVSNLDYEHVYYEPTVSFGSSGTQIKMGNAIISKVPLEDKEVLFTNNSYQQIENWDEYKGNTRNAQIVSVDLDGKKVKLVNHHGFHDTNPMGNQNSVNSMEKLISRLKDFNEPIIFCGDLNVIPDSDAMKLFKGFLRDLTEEYDVSDTLTQFGMATNIPCDHILVSDEIKVSSFKAKDDLVSDHKPLVLEVEV